MQPDFTVETLAEALRLSKPTIWKHIGNGSIHAYRLGRSVRIPHQELERIRNDNRIGGES